LFPPHRLGPTGDVAKANCGTCHQGAYKPLYGVSMLSDYPFLTGPAKVTQKSKDSDPPAKSVAMK
jgi:photosynthetic reaction center cytochrome c subunit